MVGVASSLSRSVCDAFIRLISASRKGNRSAYFLSWWGMSIPPVDKACAHKIGPNADQNTRPFPFYRSDIQCPLVSIGFQHL